MTQPGLTSTVGSNPLASEIPSNIYKPTQPWMATVVENTLLTPGSANDVCHVVLDLDGSDLYYLEGQSLGVLPPGTDPNGQPHKLRLYSIASPAVGEDGQGKHVALCVKRLVYQEADTGATRHGVCSNYLCNLKPGDRVAVTGPVGKAFLMPEHPEAHWIMIATGTGIAPFRAFLQKAYTQPHPSPAAQHWLFFGMQHTTDFLYRQELEHYQQTQQNFHLVTAISREQQTDDGKRLYVQHRLYEQGETLFKLLQQPNTYVYICGLKGMETGILEALQRVGEETGQPWEDLMARLKAEKRWRVEVY
ncbi:MAG: FAD-binding oxidoreductase [Candidatus Melainabacteria bacterium]|nr:FAD-binding oxidoreductase [Candidatus Melainabacteria bacterium]